MTREIRNEPHPTPNPDGPHAGASSRGTGPEAGRSSQSQDETATVEAKHDSCTEDLNLILSEPLAEPDPALKSGASSDTVAHTIRDADQVPSFLHERGKQPRTSEIFGGVGPQAADVTGSTAGAGNVTYCSLIESSPDPESLFEGDLVATSQPSPEGGREPRAVEWASDDDHVAESRIPWALLLVMSYSSAVTLALTWVLCTGPTFRSAEPARTHASQTEVESVSKIVDSTSGGALPPLPAENVTSLGNTLLIGDVEATPLEIVAAPLDLVRSIDPSDLRREESPALVLRLKLKNSSPNHAFAPLERRFLREQTTALDRSSITTSQGTSIGLFPLAVDSEWSIVGQELPRLKPGETVETIIASEPGTEHRLTAEMTWRVRLRIGPYRTDVLGIRFNKDDIKR